MNSPDNSDDLFKIINDFQEVIESGEIASQHQQYFNALHNHLSRKFLRPTVWINNTRHECAKAQTGILIYVFSNGKMEINNFGMDGVHPLKEATITELKAALAEFEEEYFAAKVIYGEMVTNVNKVNGNNYSPVQKSPVEIES